MPEYVVIFVDAFGEYHSTLAGDLQDANDIVAEQKANFASFRIIPIDYSLRPA